MIEPWKTKTTSDRPTGRKGHTMQYSERKLKNALSMEDSDAKLGKLETIGLSLGMFNKQPIINECNRLRSAGFISPALKYLRSKENKTA
jgi:hypothetical protein